MFEKSFYPTPPELGAKIRNMVNWESVKNICDPSVGKGDLLLEVIGATKYIGSCQNLNKNDIPYKWPNYPDYEKSLNLYGIEIDPGLRAVISNIKLIQYYNSDPERINIIGSDFLTYHGDYSFDLIVMNPPFDNGVKHLLKAWEIVRNAQIFCILNKKTIDNLCSKERELLEKIIYDNRGEVITLGQPFRQAEIKTDVECALVKLVKENPPRIQLDFSDFKEERESSFAVGFDDEKFLVQGDEIRARIERYQHKIELHKGILQAIAKFHYYGGDGFGEKNYESRLNEYIRELTMESWQQVVDLSRFSKYMTTEVKDQFNNQIKSVSLMEFTEENILSFVDMLVYSFGDIMEYALLEVFDQLTAYDKKNRIHPEGWWTNDSFRVNKKVIIPNVIENRSISWEKQKLLNDIDRVMVWISGVPLEDENNKNGSGDFCPKYPDGLVERIKSAEFGKLEGSQFFNFRVYKKGTLHVTFKDEALWQELNLRAAGRKNWLPDDYKARRKEKIKKGLLIEYKDKKVHRENLL